MEELHEQRAVLDGDHALIVQLILGLCIHNVVDDLIRALVGMYVLMHTRFGGVDGRGPCQESGDWLGGQAVVHDVGSALLPRLCAVANGLAGDLQRALDQPNVDGCGGAARLPQDARGALHVALRQHAAELRMA